MAMKLHDGIRLSSSSANPWLPRKSKRTCYSCKNVADSDYLLINWKNSRKRLSRSLSVVQSSSHRCTHLQMGIKKDFVSLRRSRSAGNLFPLASTSADDGVSVNGSPQAGSTGDVEDMRVKLDRALQDEDSNDGLVQSLHDGARVFELAIKEHSSFSKASWFARAWLGVDRNTWIKTLSYQAAVCSLLQAATEISSRGDHRDRDVNVFVQKSLSRQYAPLESIIRDNLSDKQSDIYEWFWSEQVPAVVTSFVNNFESDSRFTAATSISGKGMSVRPGSASDISLLMLALTCVAAVTKLGPAKISCSQFFSIVPDTAGRLMDMLVDFISIQQAYKSVKKIGLRREFLVHFGPRAASCRVRTERDAEEVAFWVNLVQKQLQQAIARERIWSRVTTAESIEVLERDLAIFGFFIALGRRTQAFICENGFDVLEDPVEGLIRYLIGGGVLYYPQLASISSYQLYVEVVCEELDWLPLFPGQTSNPKPVHGHKTKRDGPPNAEAIPQALDTCSHWMQSFIKYSKWLENSSNVKAARFLSRGHNKLVNCIEVMGISKSGDSSKIATTLQVLPQNESDSFDKALGSVDEALLKLENLLEELHVSSSSSGKEHLKAACSDLEKIRKLKKEAEFLEASFRAKAASLQQGDDVSQPSVNEQKQSIGKFRNKDSGTAESSKSNSRSIWSLFPRAPAANADSKFSSQDEYIQQVDAKGCEDPEADGIRRFEVLRNELMELENRVQRSASQSEKDEDIQLANASQRNDIIGETQIVQHVPKKENIIDKSLDKLKSSSRDVWQGTQLLAIDTAAACGLIRRSLVGDELTEKEKNALKRTMTDLASVVPIGVLMLLPVTAVGHAAMLAAIQRYFPSLIPSTYGAERLDLLRQLETVQKMEGGDEVNPKDPAEELV